MRVWVVGRICQTKCLQEGWSVIMSLSPSIPKYIPTEVRVLPRIGSAGLAQLPVPILEFKYIHHRIHASLYAFSRWAACKPHPCTSCVGGWVHFHNASIGLGKGGDQHKANPIVFRQPIFLREQQSFTVPSCQDSIRTQRHRAKDEEARSSTLYLTVYPANLPSHLNRKNNTLSFISK